MTVPVGACDGAQMPARTVHRNAPVTTYLSLEDFLTRDADPSGLVEIRHGLPLHLHWTDNGSDVTFVAFAGAMLSTTHTVPIFGGYTLTRKLASNVLLVSDPALVLDTSLTIVWYAGTQQVDHLQRDLTGIIRSLVGRTRVVLFGPSGGGFAALEQAPRFPGSTVLVSNPLTHVNLEPREHVDQYFDLAWGIDSPADPAEAPFVHEVISTYSEPVDTSIVCSQNAGDSYHDQLHWGPFLKQLHPQNRVLTLRPDLGPGHVGPGKRPFLELFRAVTEHEEWEEIQREVRAVELVVD